MAVSDQVLVDVQGLSIGHWTDQAARTGCTVITFDHQTLTAVEVRGAAPGTRETDLLAPGRTVQRADALLLTGGSAFGLAAAGGIVEALREQGRGYPTPAGPVPIVPGAVIYDLSHGVPVAPTAENGRRALESAAPVGEASQGMVGVGTGARWGSVTGQTRRGGLGIAQMTLDGHMVTAIVVLNAFGVLSDAGNDPRLPIVSGAPVAAGYGESTTLMSIVVSVPCDHGTLTRLCVAAHDALARSVVPAHTLFDGDVAFASTLVEGTIDQATQLRLCLATELAMEAAIALAAHPDPETGDTLKL